MVSCELLHPPEYSPRPWPQMLPQSPSCTASRSPSPTARPLQKKTADPRGACAAPVGASHLGAVWVAGEVSGCG